MLRTLLCSSGLFLGALVGLHGPPADKALQSRAGHSRLQRRHVIAVPALALALARLLRARIASCAAARTASVPLRSKLMDTLYTVWKMVAQSQVGKS